MDDPIVIALAILVIAAAAVVVLLIVRQSSRSGRCPGCGRAAVPGRADCPFCGHVYPQRTRAGSPSPPPGAQPRLDCVAGPFEGRSFPVSSGRFSLGRGTESKLRLEGTLISRNHALIEHQDDGQYMLFDAGSLNGTWVNGRRIAQHPLKPGDQIQIGPFVFAFQAAGGTVEPVPVLPTPVPSGAPPSRPQWNTDFGEYELLEPIGGGGMATVYKARSKRDGAIVAVKVSHEQHDAYLRFKFSEEIRIGKALSNPPHPHIVKVLGGNDTGPYFLVMELADNRSLRDRLQGGRPLPYDQVVTIIGQTCDALSYAHQFQIFHRDVKPENILFSSRDGVKLCDFGIAKELGQAQKTQDGWLVGTPYYMSYEQAQGQEVRSPASDIYSLGVVLYEMLTGRPPFTGEAVTVVHKHITEEPVRPRRINPAVPPQLEEVVMKALSKRADRRFQTAEQMARAAGYTAPFSRPGAQPSLAQPPAGRQTAGVGPRRPPAGEPARGAAGAARVRQPQQGLASVRLVVISTGEVLPMAKDGILLSRNLVNPKDSLISRGHAQIIRRGKQYWLQDASSRNGTYLNGQRIFAQGALLQPGDIIRVGHTELRVER